MRRTMVFLQVFDMREKRRPKKRFHNCIYPGIKDIFVSWKPAQWLHDIPSCLELQVVAYLGLRFVNRARQV